MLIAVQVNTLTIVTTNKKVSAAAADVIWIEVNDSE